MSVEYRVYQEDREQKLKLLNAEIVMQQEQYRTQVEKLQAKNSKLEHKLARELPGRKAGEGDHLLRDWGRGQDMESLFRHQSENFKFSCCSNCPPPLLHPC